MPPIVPGQLVSVVDPACGDGRFLVAAADHVAAAGGRAVLVGVDVDPAAVATARRALAGRGRRRCLRRRRPRSSVVARHVRRRPHEPAVPVAAGRGDDAPPRDAGWGGGPYADAAAEFLLLGAELARPGGGRLGIVLPQSILGSRDAGPVRRRVDRLAEPVWSWWSPRHLFDASVVVCAVGFRRRPADAEAGNRRPPDDDREPVWTGIVTRAMGIPDVPALDADRRRRRPRRAHRQLPRRVLRPGAGGRRARRRTAARHERADRPGTVPLGGAGGDVQPAPLPASSRRRVATRRPHAPLGAAPGGAQGPDRQPDPGRRVCGRRGRRHASRRPGGHRPAAGPWRRHRVAGVGRRAVGADRLGLAVALPPPAPACRRARCACARRWSPACRGPPATLDTAVAAYEAGDLARQRRRRAPRLRHRRRRRRAVCSSGGRRGHQRRRHEAERREGRRRPWRPRRGGGRAGGRHRLWRRRRRRRPRRPQRRGPARRRARRRQRLHGVPLRSCCALVGGSVRIERRARRRLDGRRRRRRI